MSNSQFIGRGEVIAKKILLKSIDCIGIEGQVNIRKIILPEDYEFIDQEIKNHNFDWVIRRTNKPDIVVEINYKHKEKAAHKWNNIFTKILIDNHKIPIIVADYNCEYLFSDSVRLRKKNPWGSFIDIIRELQRQGITPDGSLC